MGFTIVESNEQLTHLSVSGRLDLARSGELDAELNRLSARRVSVILDVSEVEFMASLVIGLIVVCAKGLARWKCRLVLVNPAPVVDKALRTTGVDQVVPIVADATQARALILGA